MQLVETFSTSKPGHGNCRCLVLKTEGEEDVAAIAAEIVQSFCGVILCPVPEIKDGCLYLYLYNVEETKVTLVSRGLLPWLQTII